MMRNTGNPNTDRDDDPFSNLPSHIVDKITNHLPLNDAVKTSLLASDWRFRWMFTPELIFDSRFRQTIHGNHQLETVVYCILSRHLGQINKFYFNIHGYSSSPHISRWIHLILLCKHQVRDFTLHLSHGPKHVIPPCFFKFQHLTHLNLQRCIFYPPLEFPGFEQLVALEFQNVQLVPEAFLNFISACARLEKIRLSGCTDLDSIEVEVPGLRTFIFHGVVSSIRFKNCPVLVDVSLSIKIPSYYYVFISGYKYFEFLPTLERLSLSRGVLEFLNAADSPDGYPRGLDRLQVLDLSLGLDSKSEVAFALKLLRASKNLEKLKVPLYPRRGYECVLNFLQTQRKLKLKKLRRVEMERFSFSEPQMVFARLLLASAPALEEMAISAVVVTRNAMSRFADFEQSSRASPDARIVLVNTIP